MFRQLYSKAIFRIPLKLVISFTVSKLFVDWFVYMRQNTHIVIPRTVKTINMLDANVWSSKSSKSTFTCTISLC